MYNAKINGVGISLPKKIVKNKDLEKIVDTTDEWITTFGGGLTFASVLVKWA